MCLFVCSAQEPAYEDLYGLGGSEMCVRGSLQVLDFVEEDKQATVIGRRMQITKTPEERIQRQVGVDRRFRRQVQDVLALDDRARVQGLSLIYN